MPTGITAELANFRSFWLGFSVATADADAELGITLYRSGAPSAMYNGVLRLLPGTAPEAAYQEVARRLAGVPAVWWVGPDSDPGTADMLGVRGLSRVGTMTVMTIDLSLVPPVEVPKGLTIAEVSGHADIGEWVRAYAPSLGAAPSAVDSLITRYESRIDAPGELIRFEARDGDRIVGTSALLNHHGVAGIYLVTTAEPYRRRGIGRALTIAALTAGRERGLTVGTLQTGSAARLYAGIGFRPVAELQLFRASGE